MNICSHCLTSHSETQMSFHPMLEPQSLKRELSIACYEKGKRIGSGGQGTVYEYTQAPNDKGYAVKILYNDDADGNTKHKRNILREQSASAEFEHVTYVSKTTMIRATLTSRPT